MLKNASILTISRFVGDGLSLLLFIFLSRSLGPEGVGQYAFGLAIALLVRSFVTFGLDDLAIRDLARLPARERVDFLAKLLGFQVVLIAIVIVLFAGFLLFDRVDRTTIVICSLLSTSYAGFGLAHILFTPAFSQQQITGQSLAEVSTRAGIVAATLVLVLAQFPLQLALLPFPVGGLVLVAIALRSARRHNGALKFVLSRRQVRTAFELAWPFGVGEILFTMQVRISYMVLGFMSGPAATGIYAFGIKFVETGILPMTYLGMAVFPLLSKNYMEGAEKLNRTANRHLRLSLIGGALLAWFLLFVLPSLIIPVLGSRFSSTIPLLPLFSLLAVIWCADVPLNRLLFASGLQKLNVRFTFWGVMANAVIAMLLVPVLGIYGAVVGTICGQVVISALSLVALLKSGIKLYTFRIAAVYLASIVIAVTAGQIAQNLFGSSWFGAAAALTIMFLVWLCGGFLSDFRDLARLNVRTPIFPRELE